MHLGSESTLSHSRRCESAIASYTESNDRLFRSRLLRPFSPSVFQMCSASAFTSIFRGSVIRQRWCGLSFMAVASLAAYRRNFALVRDTWRSILTFHLHKPKIRRPSYKNHQCGNAFEYSRTVCLKLCSPWNHPVCWISIDECCAIWMWHWGISDICLQIKTILCRKGRFRPG